MLIDTNFCFRLTRLSRELVESLQLYHTLMAEMPPPPAVSMPYVAPGTKNTFISLFSMVDTGHWTVYVYHE